MPILRILPDTSRPPPPAFVIVPPSSDTRLQLPPLIAGVNIPYQLPKQKMSAVFRLLDRLYGRQIPPDTRPEQLNSRAGAICGLCFLKLLLARKKASCRRTVEGYVASHFRNSTTNVRFDAVSHAHRLRCWVDQSPQSANPGIILHKAGTDTHLELLCLCRNGGFPQVLGVSRRSSRAHRHLLRLGSRVRKGGRSR